MLVDPKCYDLAVLFLAEVPSATDEDRTELAEEIQATIEDFISSLSSADDEEGG